MTLNLWPSTLSVLINVFTPWRSELLQTAWIKVSMSEPVICCRALMPLGRKWKKLPNNLQIDANVVTSNSCCSAPLFVKTSSCVEPSWLKFNSVHLTKMFWAAALYPGLDKALGKWSIQDGGGEVLSHLIISIQLERRKSQSIYQLEYGQDDFSNKM